MVWDILDPACTDQCGLRVLYPMYVPMYYTVGPLYKGHIGTSKFVHCREVVHSSEVENVLAL